MEFFKNYAAAALSGVSILGVTVLFTNLSTVNGKVNSLEQWREEAVPLERELEHTQIRTRVDSNSAKLSMLEAEIELLEERIRELR